MWDHSPPMKDSRSHLPPEGFEPLTKDSRNDPLTNCTILDPRVGSMPGTFEDTVAGCTLGGGVLRGVEGTLGDAIGS
jgi:hypothetical protein